MIIVWTFAQHISRSMGDVHLEGSNASAEEADEGQYRCVLCFSENFAF